MLDTETKIIERIYMVAESTLNVAQQNRSASTVTYMDVIMK